MLSHGNGPTFPSYICNVKKQGYQNILILIVVTATVLIAAQVYFTIQSYKANKARFIQDVQQSLNTSIEDYFANRAKSSIFVLSNTPIDSLALDSGITTTAMLSNITGFDSLSDDREIRKISVSSSSFSHVWTNNGDSSQNDTTMIQVSGGLEQFGPFEQMDTARVKKIRFLTEKVMFSISEDLLDLGELYDGLSEDLKSKGMNIEFALRQETEGRKTAIGSLKQDNYLTTEANSTYLGDFHSISIDFENATLMILRNGISELILSFLLIGLVIGTMIHLYKTIYAQKQLAAIKDDLISNITHEFKTPIATIFSALEGVTSFNKENDPEKTKRYLSLSNDQLHKLNHMVEKMLETATLDQGKITLDKEEFEVSDWTRSLVERYQMVEETKNIEFETNEETIICLADRFHLENTLTNLIDNALKYGGQNILIRIVQEGSKVVWEIQDDGSGIPKDQRDKIFDKLYRIPTGNKHDVKGFGIGLYYSRTIAEMHDGSLVLDGAKDKTIFRLSI